MEDIQRLKSLAMHCLLGNVPPNLRICTIDKINDTVYWRCIFSSNASDDEIDLLRCTGTEIIADFLTEDIIEEYSRDDFIGSRDVQGHVVFMIDEEINRELYKKRLTDVDLVEIKIEMPAFYSALDESAFLFQAERISLKKPIGVRSSLQISVIRSNEVEYIHSLFGFFFRYELDMTLLKSVVNETNRSIILDKNMFWYRRLTKGLSFFSRKRRIA